MCNYYITILFKKQIKIIGKKQTFKIENKSRGIKI